MTRTETEPATLAVESWAYETANLPRVLPDGWTHFEMIAVALEVEVDGVVAVDPDPDGAVGSATHWYDATVTTDATDHDHVRVASVGNDDGGDDGTEGDGAGDESADADAGSDPDESTQTTLGHDGETTTEEFDVNDALDRL